MTCEYCQTSSTDQEEVWPALATVASTSMAEVANRRAPNDAGGQRQHCSAPGTLRRLQYRSPRRSAQIFPRIDRGSALCFRGSCRPMRLQMHLRHRCPCQQMTLRQTNPGRHLKLQRHRGQCRALKSTRVGRGSPSGQLAGTALRAAA